MDVMRGRGKTTMRSAWTSLVSWPPSAVPPLSEAEIRTVADPCSPANGSNRSVPLTLTTGANLSSSMPPAATRTLNDRSCGDSPSTPDVMFVCAVGR